MHFSLAVCYECGNKESAWTLTEQSRILVGLLLNHFLVCEGFVEYVHLEVVLPESVKYTMVIYTQTLTDLSVKQKQTR